MHIALFVCAINTITTNPGTPHIFYHKTLFGTATCPTQTHSQSTCLVQATINNTTPPKISGSLSGVKKFHVITEYLK